jgi:pimeloyl-ACP methyl ester carboxylesterase
MRTSDLHVVHDGSRQAPPLLLIHGSGAAGASWAPMVRALADRHHVIRVDLPGCGRSKPPPSYDVPAQAASVADVLDDLAYRHVAVAGHSSGGYVATALAEQRPDLVRSIVLIGTGPRLDALRPQPLLLRALLAPPFGPLIWSVRSDKMIRAGLRATTVRPVEISDEVVAGVRGTTYRSMRGVLSGNHAYLAERCVPDRLKELGLPVLMIQGASDPRWDPAAAHRYETVPGARVEFLPGVGHVPLLEAPDETSKLLLDFTET